MKKGNFSWVAVCLLTGMPVFAEGFGSGIKLKTHHNDYRTTPKVEAFEITKNSTRSKQDPLTVALNFLREKAPAIGLKDHASELVLTSTRYSLLGTHFSFQQIKDGLEVTHGGVSVSVDNASNAVYHMYNNYYPQTDDAELDSPSAKKALLSKSRIYDLAWQDLKVHGELQDQPKAHLAFDVNPETGDFKLVYETYLHVDAPRGAWRHVIDARSGNILKRENTLLERKATYDIDPIFYRGPIADRSEAFAKFAESKLAKHAARHPAGDRANGSGLVFDPDPRATLGDETLHDDSEPARFEDAYFRKELLDITFDGGVYKLEGPWVKIVDFEAPNTAPSTTTDGVWNAKRGNNAFNDTMTYFHIDQNQRYMQSLGFVDEKMIQGAPIEVDTDGLNGADNSYFLIQRNRLAFGHGCVDDNEDADVILHEYGHAINHHINPNFVGGDTGAMGEGFGDYWAGSYSISTEGGAQYKPFETFTWDARGPGNKSCWPGRVLNAVHLKYNHSTRYEAHRPIGGSNQSDELWSSPLFMSLVQLMELGVTREEVDQIILEAQFGLGAGIKMRDMATNIVATAQRLYPNGPHAEVFYSKFVDQKILAVPSAELEVVDIDFVQNDGDFFANPGDELDIVFVLKNTGDFAANQLAGLITPISGPVTVLNSHVVFGELAAGSTITSQVHARVRINNDAGCGEEVKLKATLSYVDSRQVSKEMDLTFNVGKPVVTEGKSSPGLDIPDNNPMGASTAITLDSDAKVSSNFQVTLNLAHTYISDLTVTLTSPNGVSVRLHERTGGSQHNIIGTYPTTLKPMEPLSKLIGQNLRGEWTLHIVDRGNGDFGSLLSWEIRDVSHYECR